MKAVPVTLTVVPATPEAGDTAITGPAAWVVLAGTMTANDARISRSGNKAAALNFSFVNIFANRRPYARLLSTR